MCACHLARPRLINLTDYQWDHVFYTDGTIGEPVASYLASTG